MPMFENMFPLRTGRAHEATGAGATGFAAIACGLNPGPALWIVEGWRAEQLYPPGLAEFCDPAKLLVARVKDTAEALASAEEALRSGAVATVVADVSGALSLIAGRRLQLAAETGKATGILLVSEGHGNNATETRWRCSPAFDARDSTLQRWELIKNKRGTLTSWTLRWNAEAHRILVVSETSERAGTALPSA